MYPPHKGIWVKISLTLFTSYRTNLFSMLPDFQVTTRKAKQVEFEERLPRSFQVARLTFQRGQLLFKICSWGTQCWASRTDFCLPFADRKPTITKNNKTAGILLELYTCPHQMSSWSRKCVRKISGQNCSKNVWTLHKKKSTGNHHKKNF